MKLDISLILKAMLKKVAGRPKFALSSAAKKNIKEIQRICNKDFSNQKLYGSAALNRKILLDARIADLLTPETIQAILAIHAHLTSDVSKSLIGIKRNSSGYVSLAAVLFYGFKEGTQVLELMPNNETSYGIAKYQEQKNKFLNNTNKIIENIKIAAIQMEINLEDEQFQVKDVKEPSLEEQYQQVESSIAKIKSAKKNDELLQVPGYTAKDIRQQSLHGFKKICAILKINCDSSSSSLQVAATLDEFVSRFLESEEALLNGTVIHLFYDRVHLKACLEQDSRINFHDKECTLREVFEKMVAKCVTSSNVSPIAKEQFGLRFKLCDTHIQENFTVENEHQKIDESIKDLPHGYKFLKKMIYDLEVEIDKEVWTGKNIPKLNALNMEKVFLAKILEFYDQLEGKLPLKNCLTLAKEALPQAYNEIKPKFSTQFFLNILNEKFSVEPTQGPRYKNNATVALQSLLHQLIEYPFPVNYSFNAFNELEISLGPSFFNLTQILKNNPDFEQITFTDRQLTSYVHFLKTRAINKPLFQGPNNGRDFFPSEKDYESKENRTKENDTSHLHYAEKLAVTLYCSNFNLLIQKFLRNDGRVESNKELNTSRQLITEVLLSAAIATHGLVKPREVIHDSEKSISNFRKEVANLNAKFLADKITSEVKKTPLLIKGFVSTSADNSYKISSANIFTIVHEESKSKMLGRNVSAVARYKEKESLYSPRTQFQYTDYHSGGKEIFFAAKPIRSIDGMENNQYTNKMLAKHELEIIDKMFELYLVKHKHSFFFRLFDTVSNSKKLNCIRQAKDEIKKILEILNAGVDLTTEHLQTAKEALEKGINTNAKIVKDAFLPASVGTTYNILKDALVRVSRANMLLVTRQQTAVESDPRTSPTTQI